MGQSVEFNWVLKLTEEQGMPKTISEGQIYSFKKKGSRVYPAGIPIHLVDAAFTAIGLAVVDEYTVRRARTSGIFRILKIYDGEEKKLLTENLRERYAQDDR